VKIDYGQANLAISFAVVDELADRGLRHAVICPGSRSTPLAVAFAKHPQIKIWVLIDERSAGYFALGMARQLATPVAVLSTSGTAAANILPAVVEANLSRIPLIVLTADRPPELRDWGAAQTIDQMHLFGSHSKWFVDMPVPDGELALVRHARATAARAIEWATTPPAGPIHVNAPFREPLLPATMPSLGEQEELFSASRSCRAVHDMYQSARSQIDDRAVADLSAVISRDPRGIIVCGPGETPGLATAVCELATAAGYPILADALSGVRFGSARVAGMVDSYDSFIRDPATAAALAPEIVIRVGAIPTSKPLQLFLNGHPGHHHIVIDPSSPRDPFHLATDVVKADPATVLSCCAQTLCAANHRPNVDWIERWQLVEWVTSAAIQTELASDDQLFEGRALAEIAALLPDHATLIVGNSMPVRDLDTFVRGDGRCLRVMGNRGASGIDGVVSSALGAAAVSHQPVVLIVGDLSFYHDMNGLMAANQYGLAATIVVLNNDGGGIFSFLPQAETLDRATFESLFGTPIGLNVERAAHLYGARYARPSDWTALRQAISASISRERLSIVEVVTDRTRNVVQHRAVSAAVADALRMARDEAA
jgi:2-succinyl-5-enolpyruvyl-6-hydroxy-3-cyclohexene-1-carboxylate synthase